MQTGLGKTWETSRKRKRNEHLLRNSGFRVVRIHHTEMNVEFRNRDGFRQAMVEVQRTSYISGS